LETIDAAFGAAAGLRIPFSVSSADAVPGGGLHLGAHEQWIELGDMNQLMITI